MAEAKKKQEHIGTRDEGYRQIYANTLKAGHTQFDVTITFGQIVQQVDGDIARNDLVAIQLSPQHAKVFHKLLGRVVEGYEEQHGTINFKADSGEVVPSKKPRTRKTAT